MPILVLSPRYTPDSNALWQAAIRANWPVTRLQNHHAPDELTAQQVVLYGEALFVAMIADQLNIALLETPLDSTLSNYIFIRWEWLISDPYVPEQGV